MTTRPPPKQGRIYGWIFRHRWLVGLIFAGIAAIAAVANVAKEPVRIVGPNSPPTTKQEAEDETLGDFDEPGTARPETVKAMRRQARAADLHKLIVDQRPEIRSFLFADYVHESADRRGWVHVYSASRTRFVETDKLSCSYPDQTTVTVDYDARYLLVACGFPYDPTRDASAENFRSYVVVTIWFFDSDRKAAAVFECKCVSLYQSNPHFDAERRSLYVTLSGDSTIVTGSPAPSEIEVTGQAVRAHVQFDEQWEPISLRAVRSYE